MTQGPGSEDENLSGEESEHSLIIIWKSELFSSLLVQVGTTMFPFLLLILSLFYSLPCLFRNMTVPM